jgi:serine O-acetyltransferase
MSRFRYFVKDPILGIILSVYYFKSIRVFLLNHLTIGLKELYYKRIKLPHPVGVVIGKNVSMGYDCIVYQNVTIGTKDTFGENALYPVIKNNVIIYPNAIIIGDIVIGENAVIGAGAVVLNDVPPNSTVVGNPARILSV